MNNKKNAKLQYWKDQMLIEIKGYVNPIDHQPEENMENDGMNENEINPNVHGCMVNPCPC
jgi:hypothetical protein